MRVIKWLFTGLFIVFLLVGIVFAYLAMTFDANDHKQTIVDIVKERTGRDVDISGELQMSFYPWLGISMGQTRVSNANGFDSEQFAEFEQASARLQLMPLLQKKIVADRIELSGAEIWLERNKEGVTNWDDILEKLGNSSEDPVENVNATSVSGAIAGLEIKDAIIHWQDAASGDALTISQLNLDTGKLALDQETSIDTDFHFQLQKPIIQGQAKLLARSPLSLKPPYILRKPNLELNLQGIDLQAQNIQANIVGDELSFLDGKLSFTQPNIVYDISNMPSLGEQAKGTIKGDTLHVDAGNIVFRNFDLNGNIQGSALPGETADATITSETLRFVNKTLKLDNAKLQSSFTGEPWPQGQQSITAEFENVDFDTAKSSLSISSFAAQMLGVNVSGNVSASNVTSNVQLRGKLLTDEFSPKQLAKTLSIELPDMSDEAWQRAILQGEYTATKNSFDFKKMTATIDGVAWTGAAAIDDLEQKKLSFDLAAQSLDLNRLLPQDQAEALKDNESEQSENQVNRIEIPTAPLRIWDLDGQVALGKFTFGNMISTEVNVKVNLLDGLLQLNPTSMQVFGGKESGNWTLDARNDVLRLTGQEKFQAIDLAQVGAAMWQKQHMTGKISGQITVDTQGKTIGDMRAGLNGHLNVKVDDGVMQGIDVNYALANAVSLFREKTLASETDTKQTPFQQLSATGKIENGVLKNDDFLAVLPRMRVRGKGSFNFVDTGINYYIDADVLESKSAALDPSVEVSLDELVGATIPIKISGDLSEPTIRPDVGGFLKAKLTQEVRERAREEIEDKLKDKVGGELGGLLGGLLGGDTSDIKTNPDTNKQASEPESNAEQSEPEAQATNEDTAAENSKDDNNEDNGTEEKPLTPEEELKKKEEELKQKAKDKLKDLFGG